MPARNEIVHMTRRYPQLMHKVLKRDSVIVKRIMDAWDSNHDSEKVLSIYLKEQNNLSDERYWEILRTVWILSGKVDNQEVFRNLMRSNRKERYYFSTPEEAFKLRSMPEEFRVYRATNSEADKGLSWTVSIKYAEHYQRMFNKAMIITRVIKRKEVFAFVERNQEDEIIIL